MNELPIISRPSSAFSEEIKKVRTNLKFSSINEDVKVIAVTSSVPGEGKSFTTANLAVAFAQNGEKVILLDCDLRKGRQKKIFNVPVRKSEGLSNLLINKEWKAEYKSYIKELKIENLSLIPSGPFPPNPSELLASARFSELLEILKEEYDVILLDCPPINGLNDTLVIGSKSDISILVTKYKSTSIDLLEKSKKALEAVGSKVVGIILNQVDTKETNYYYGYYYKDE